jgi:hypothetical protein
MRRFPYSRMMLAALLGAAGCAGVTPKSMTGTGGTTGGGVSSGTGGTGTTPTGAGGARVHTQTGVCTNLQCRQNSCTAGACTQTACPAGATTSLSGTVYDPAGKVPLYNVVVYIPNEPLAPLKEGAACETCDGNFSGKPIAVTLSDAAGHFKLDDVPVGADVPVVVQIGKWRRQIVIPKVTACTDTPIADKELTRLPRNKTEGDLPKIAIATGGSDALECLLRKVGIDEAEFSNDAGTGRVQLYQGYRAAPTIASGGAPANLRTVNDLWGSLANMMRYDVVLMACEGSSGEAESRTAAQYQVVRGYADMGGRVFGSHYHNGWIRSEDGTPSAGYPQVVKFASGAHGFTTDIVTQVDSTFPKGMAFRDWLANTGASTTPGQLLITGGEHTVDAVIAGVSQQWIYGSDDSKKTPMVQYFSFTAPVAQKECGRMVFSDVHVSAGGGPLAAVPFPMRCTAGTDLSPQEKALEFMLFDLSSCVQKDDRPVEPPPIVQ